MTDATVSVCALLDCHQSAAKSVVHPHRPEPATPLCQHHAATVLEQVTEAEVVANA